jgi:zinc transport system permease protein
MFELMAEMFSYPFLTAPGRGGARVALCGAVRREPCIKRYSMIGDGLSHVGFGALAIATAMNASPLTVDDTGCGRRGVLAAAHEWKTAK